MGEREPVKDLSRMDGAAQERRSNAFRAATQGVGKPGYRMKYGSGVPPEKPKRGKRK